MDRMLTVTLSEDEMRGLSVLVGSIGPEDRERAIQCWLNSKETLHWPEDYGGNVVNPPGRVYSLTPKIDEELATASIEKAIAKLTDALAAHGIDMWAESEESEGT